MNQSVQTPLHRPALSSGEKKEKEENAYARTFMRERS
jgi:hypothetical protein